MSFKRALFIILLLAPTGLKAQTWDKNYLTNPIAMLPFDYFRNNQGAFVVGQTEANNVATTQPFVIKLNNQGDSLWAHTSFIYGLDTLFPVSCAQQTNGNILIGMNTYELAGYGLVKMSPTGNVTSHYVIPTAHVTGNIRVIATPDNGYYFNHDLDTTSITNSNSTYYTGNRSFVERYDSNGVRLWRHLFQFQHTESYQTAMFGAGDTHIDNVNCFRTYDDGLIYAIKWDTISYAYQNYKYSIQKLNNLGNIAWTIDLQSLINPGAQYQLSLTNLFGTSDSGFVVNIGIVDISNNSEIFHLIKFNKANVVTDTLSLPSGCWVRGGVETSTGDLLFNSGCGPVDHGFSFYDKHLHYISYMPSPFPPIYSMMPNAQGGAFTAIGASNSSGTINYLRFINFDSLFDTYPSSISGTQVLDKNNNCTTNSTDLRVKDNLVGMADAQDNQWFAFTNDTGHYKVNVPNGNLSLFHSISGYKAAECPATSALSYSITTPTQYTNVNLYDTLIPNKSDIGLSMYNFLFVPGFDNTLYLNLNNYGTVTANTTLTFIKDPIVQFLSSVPAPTSVSGDTVRYTVSNLVADSSLGIVINLHTPASATAGQGLNFYASAPFANDLHLADNTAALADTIVSSFDPNELSVNKAKRFDPNTGEMIYAVEFQNTGTHFAKNVIVVDSVDSHLDMATFHLINGAPIKPAISWWQGNRLLFTFNNIMLPDSLQNPKGSIGTFAYGIRPKTTAKPGDSIRNTAYIYFDYNKGVVTNTTINIINKKPNEIFQVVNNNYVTVYPNPSTGSFTIVMQQATGCIIKMMDMAGREVACKYTANGDRITLDTDVPNGIYLVRVMMPETKQCIVKKVTVIR